MTLMKSQSARDIRTAVTAILWIGLVSCIIAVKCTGDVVSDITFMQDYHEEFPIGGDAANDVRALAFDNHGWLWAATGAGVRTLAPGEHSWVTPEGGGDVGSALSVCCDRSGTVWIGGWNGLYRSNDGKVAATSVTGSAIGAVHASPAPGASRDEVFAAGPAGIWRSTQSGSFEKLKGAWQTVIRAVLPADARNLWVGTASGLYLQRIEPMSESSVRYSHPNVLMSSNINALLTLPDGEMAIGTTGGIDFYRGEKRVHSLSAKEGIPCRIIRSLAVDSQGRIWAATHIGVVRYDHGKWNLRHSKRWLMNDDARDVAIGPDGTAWVATAAGVDAIRQKPLTLQAKADYFLEQLRTRHLREPGLVGPAVLVTPGDLSKSFIEDDDNDGEHTGMYLAMESMRYAVTKDPTARDNAKVAFHALMALQRVTGTHHFIARSMIRVGGPVAPRHEVDRVYTPEQVSDSLRTDPRQKIIEKRWVLSADGKWYWKRDASSDEVDGHMFGYATYFDLAADEDEKRLVADEVDRLIGGIVDHGFLLTDIDGKGTEWGNWSPASLNGDPNWHEERAGNSVEIIGFLGVAYHMTANKRYMDTARELIDKHGYARNMLQTIFDTPSERTHIEDELLTIVYPGLLNHLILPTLKSVAETSMQNWHRSCERDGIPFYDFVYNRYSGKTVNLDRAVETLRDWPLSHIEWTVDSSMRDDVQRDLTPGLEDGFITKLLPRSDMGLCMWDQEPYKVSIGNGGQREDRQNDWLLAYWMGRYYGLVGAPANSHP